MQYGGTSSKPTEFTKTTALRLAQVDEMDSYPKPARVMSIESGSPLTQSRVGKSSTAYVIVLGNEKGGSGKSTVAMHVAVALLQAGQRVATIDLDCRQKSFTHYVENRRDWAIRNRVKLEIPTHYHVARSGEPRLDAMEAQEFAAFTDAVSALDNSHDFVVIDTPGADSYLMRLAHSMADTLITPINDSFVDFDVLGAVDPTTFAVIGVSHYAELVRDARRQRRLVDGGMIDWIVVRNRLSALGSWNKRLLDERVHDLARELGFRSADGFAERVVYREFFPRGLTVLDDDARGLGFGVLHDAARAEVQYFVDAMKLPINERGRRRAITRAEWVAAAKKPLETQDLLVE
jgi:chromosome partitioning protein